MSIIKEPTAPQVYPSVPDDPTVYRFSKILTLEKEIKEEILKYEKLLKKYKKINKACSGMSYTVQGISFGASSAAFGTIAGGITILASIPLATIGGISALASMAFTSINNKMNLKIRKHASTLEAAKNTLLNLKNMTSKLITDGKITQEEFTAVLELEKNYRLIKKELREKTRKEKIKKAFINGQETMRKKLIREE